MNSLKICLLVGLAIITLSQGAPVGDESPSSAPASAVNDKEFNKALDDVVRDFKHLKATMFRTISSMLTGQLDPAALMEVRTVTARIQLISVELSDLLSHAMEPANDTPKFRAESTKELAAKSIEATALERQLEMIINKSQASEVTATSSE